VISSRRAERNDHDHGLLLVLPAPPNGGAGRKATGTEAELRRMTGELLGAVASGDWAVLGQYLDDSMVYTSEEGAP